MSSEKHEQERDPSKDVISLNKQSTVSVALAVLIGGAVFGFGDRIMSRINPAETATKVNEVQLAAIDRNLTNLAIEVRRQMSDIASEVREIRRNMGAKLGREEVTALIRAELGPLSEDVRVLMARFDEDDR